MPIHYTVDIARGIVRVVMTGIVGPAETLRFLEALAGDPAVRQGMPQLLDMRRVEAPPSSADSESVASGFERLRDRFAGARCAVVVEDPLVFGAIRQFAALAARAAVEVRPFLHDTEAERWLGVRDPLQ